MGTVKGETCRICGEGKTEYVALMPFKDFQPHRYAVCPSCYREQFAMKYGKEEACPV